jgi:Flp pilus assembly protein TadB
MKKVVLLLMFVCVVAVPSLAQPRGKWRKSNERKSPKLSEDIQREASKILSDDKDRIRQARMQILIDRKLQSDKDKKEQAEANIKVFERWFEEVSGE